MAEAQRIGHEIEFGRRFHDIGQIGEIFQPDISHVIGDIDQAQFRYDLTDRIGYDDFACRSVRLAIHECDLPVFAPLRLL